MDVIRASEPRSVTEAARIIRGGGVVAIPTDTFYGLAADPLNESALDRILRIKSRDEGKGILVLIGDFEMMRLYTGDVPRGFETWQVWPGAVTFLFRANAGLPQLLTAATGRIGLRLPEAPFVPSLCRALGHGLTGTSANRSGEPSARSVQDLAPIAAEIDAAIDGGTLHSPAPSTIIDLSGPAPMLIRAGAVDFTDLLRRIPR